MAIRTHAVDCPVCKASGRVEVNVTRDASTGTWDYDERPCGPCNGTGQLPAPVHYETSTLPSGRLQWRCLFCRCHVNPLTHLPGSEDCDRAEDERRHSREDWAS